MTWKRTILLIVLAILAGIVVLRVFPDRSAQEGKGELEASLIAQRFVKRELPYPGSASFPSVMEARVTPLTSDGYGGFIYMVRSYVNAMDDDRRMTRMSYRCKVQALKNGNWMLLELTFE